MNLTPEQLAILSTNHDMVINAVAGSGKTTTLIEYAKRKPSTARILYLAFNKTVKNEAELKFNAAGLNNVKVETAHSLAFDRIVKRSRYNVVVEYKSYEWIDLLNINTGDLHTDYMISNHISKFISYFCNSTATKVQDLNYTDTVQDQQARQFVHHYYDLIEKFTRLALAKMDKAEISITHDFYLKKFQLSNPKLAYDYILFDEGQDASGAMLQVFLEQPAVKIIVGDMHQQIYGWRYAINSLQKVDFSFYPLSHSFRFDDEIAFVANKVLSWKRHLDQQPAVQVIGDGVRSPVIFSKATLARTNVSLMVNAINLWQSGKIKKVFFEGNINSYVFADEGASLYDVLNLYNGKLDKIKDKVIKSVNSIKALEEYIEKTEDNSLRSIVEVVKQYGNDLPWLIKDLKENHAASKEEADMVFSTIHRCKGLEYDEVTLLNDFITEEKLLKNIADSGDKKMRDIDKERLTEEVNILYVAITRAKNRLIIPPELNPMQSVQVQIQDTPTYKRKYTREVDEFETLRNNRLGFSEKGNSRTASNHGKSWKHQEEQDLIDLYQQGLSLEEIAKKLKRGANGVRFKLIGLGLVDDYDTSF
ncbi:UvrD-helicase domain-containing protein [Chitinophagaceae bacterium LB-8]|uniref:DNA 3'-5' helicase n=1 Tax=Paraflavisolibacter caeni TaxID=2982496 RepID=A0A9X3BHS0_9BACT|nr:UvrD-helicase domain-containing protein [Paraflavisolibacter caeni]MCU7549068.1 UvrD-helicase domain-containing protein [Paraflavisolibacter caeni]